MLLLIWLLIGSPVLPFTAGRTPALPPRLTQHGQVGATDDGGDAVPAGRPHTRSSRHRWPWVRDGEPAVVAMMPLDSSAPILLPNDVQLDQRPGRAEGRGGQPQSSQGLRRQGRA